MNQQKIPQIVVTLEGGIIQNIDSDLPVRVIILDFDNDVGEIDDPKEITFTDPDGEETKAIVTVWEEKDVHSPKISEHIFKQLYKPE